MDYEQKYKEALERAKKNYDATQDLCNGSQIGVECFKNTLTNIFPELKESEDERIKKRLIDLLYKVYVNTNYITYVELENMIGWIEKQGDTTSDIRYDGVNAGASLSVVNGNSFDYEHATISQKDFAQKQEPKFKIGDWIACEELNTAKIISLDDDKYEVEFIDGNKGFPHIDYIDRNFHLWTIQDAKNGDVLACGDKVTDCPFIFHNLTKELNPRSYCGVNMLQHFQDNDENGGFWCHSDEVRPATKEQRDLLFQKMKEAGYEWDNEKKELKIVDWSKHIKYEPNSPSIIEQKPTWSEDDDYNLQCMIAKVTYDIQKGNVGRNNELIDWLKSLKYRM